MAMREPLAILVTGSSSGFGELTSKRLARRGHRVFAGMRDVAGRNAAAAAALEKLAGEEDLKLSAVELDVCDDALASAAVESVLGAAGRLDVLVNNAGSGILGMLETLSTDQARDLFESNLFSVLRMNRAVLPHMRARGSGLLVHVSSGLGRFVLPFNGMYCATKYALEAIAETYRYELASVGVDSVIVEPGVYATRFFENASAILPADGERANGYPELQRISRDMADRRPPAGDPQEVAEAIARLVELGAGMRPLRTTVGWSAQRADGLNASAVELGRAVLERARMLEVATLAGRPATEEV
jgi:NAD(P)-dependent dehydrogenase (short-subunit alcohol dehydrogenase family)